MLKTEIQLCMKYSTLEKMLLGISVNMLGLWMNYKNNNELLAKCNAFIILIIASFNEFRRKYFFFNNVLVKE